MTKNVIVVDELGNEYAPTYAKRARGLVKQGRARWLDENTICLACPPDIIDSEDNEMENKEKISIVEDTEIVTTTEVQPKETNASATVADVLARMDKIIAQGEEMAKVMQLIHDLPVNESPYGGEDGKARAEAIRDIYVRREVTNQKIMDMLNDMMHSNPMYKEQREASLNTTEKTSETHITNKAKKSIDALEELRRKHRLYQEEQGKGNS